MRDTLRDLYIQAYVSKQANYEFIPQYNPSNPITYNPSQAAPYDPGKTISYNPNQSNKGWWGRLNPKNWNHTPTNAYNLNPTATYNPNQAFSYSPNQTFSYNPSQTVSYTPNQAAAYNVNPSNTYNSNQTISYNANQTNGSRWSKFNPKNWKPAQIRAVLKGAPKWALKELNPLSPISMYYSMGAGLFDGQHQIQSAGFGFTQAPDDFNKAYDITQQNMDNIYNSYKEIPNAFRAGILPGLLTTVGKLYDAPGDAVRLLHNGAANVTALYAQNKIDKQRVKDLHKQATSSNKLHAELARRELDAIAKGTPWTEEDRLREENNAIARYKRNRIDAQNSSINNLPDGSASKHVTVKPYKSRYDDANFQNKTTLNNSKNRVV